MDIQNNGKGNVFPREPNGNQNRSIYQADDQLRQTFSNSVKQPQFNSPWRGGFSLYQVIQRVIFQLFSHFIRNNQFFLPPPESVKPPIDGGVRAIYGAPVAERPPNDGGIRAVYGAAIAEKPPEDEGARGVYGGAIGVTEASSKKND